MSARLLGMGLPAGQDWVLFLMPPAALPAALAAGGAGPVQGLGGAVGAAGAHDYSDFRGQRVAAAGDGHGEHMRQHPP